MQEYTLHGRPLKVPLLYTGLTLVNPVDVLRPHVTTACRRWRRWNVGDRLRLGSRCRLGRGLRCRLLAFLGLGLGWQHRCLPESGLDHLHALLAGDARLADGPLADLRREPFLEEEERQAHVVVDHERITVLEVLPELDAACMEGEAPCWKELRLLEVLHGCLDLGSVTGLEVSLPVATVEVDVAHRRELGRLANAHQLRVIAPGMCRIEAHVAGVIAVASEHLAQDKALTIGRTSIGDVYRRLTHDLPHEV